MTDYLVKKKSLTDSLSFANLPISEKEQIMHVLAGVRSEYGVVVTMATFGIEPFRMREIASLLLTHKARVDKNAIKNVKSVNFSNNTYGRGRYSGKGRGGYVVNSERSNVGGYFRREGRSNFRGGKNQSKLQYQICYRVGHISTHCYYRFNQSF